MIRSRNILFGGILLALLLGTIPVSALAQGFPNFSGPILSCTGNYLSDSPNKCTSLCDLLATLKNVLDIGLTYIVFVIVPIFFVVGGGMMLVSGGSEKLVSQAKSMMTSAVVGMIIALSGYLIITTFLWAVGNPSSGGVGWPAINCVPGDMIGGQISDREFRDIPQGSATSATST